MTGSGDGTATSRTRRARESAWKPQLYFDLGEQTLTFGVLYGRGQHSGVEVVMPYAGVARWRDGVCVYWKAYAHKEEALRDLGLPEEALEPLDA